MKFKIFIYSIINQYFIPINGIDKDSVKNTLNQNHFSFQCTKCGKCCYGPGSVYFSNKELIEIKKYLKLDQTQWKELKQKIIHKNQNGLFIHKTYNKCYFLNTKNQCSIYPVRPLQCRTFPFWPSYFKSPKNLQNLILFCPGSNLLKDNLNKKIFSPDEIVFYCNTTIQKFNQNQIKQNKKDLIKL